MGLVQTQSAFKYRIHAILHRHGVLHDYSDLFAAPGRRLLQQLALGKDSPLRVSAKIALKGELQLLNHLRRQIAGATRLFRRRVQENALAQRLMTLPGVSWILAYTLLAEIGRIERFRTSKHLASYSLLAPVADDSGDDDGSNPQGRHVGFIGRSTLKWAFIEAAHTAVRSDPRMRSIFNRCTDNGTRNRNRGYVTVARHLAVCTFVIWKKQIDYSPTPPPRPGSEKQRRKHAPPSKGAHAAQTKAAPNRPGTGQSDQPMVAVA